MGLSTRDVGVYHQGSGGRGDAAMLCTWVAEAYAGLPYKACACWMHEHEGALWGQASVAMCCLL
jgi:hypothetical protein